jgi:hypothetical protein
MNVLTFAHTYTTDCADLYPLYKVPNKSRAISNVSLLFVAVVSADNERSKYELLEVAVARTYMNSAHTVHIS